MEKILGKIESAEFGTMPDRGFLLGLQLTFSMNGGTSSIGCGGKYTVNVGSSCKWEYEHERPEAITVMVDNLKKILSDAKVNYVSQLVGKPVEITIDGGWFKDFRILTEVL